MWSWSGNHSPGGISLGSKSDNSHLCLGTELCPEHLIVVNSSSSWPSKSWSQEASAEIGAIAPFCLAGQDFFSETHA